MPTALRHLIKLNSEVGFVEVTVSLKRTYFGSAVLETLEVSLMRGLEIVVSMPYALQKHASFEVHRCMTRCVTVIIRRGILAGKKRTSAEEEGDSLKGHEGGRRSGDRNEANLEDSREA